MQTAPLLFCIIFRGLFNLDNNIPISGCCGMPRGRQKDVVYARCTNFAGNAKKIAEKQERTGKVIHIEICVKLQKNKLYTEL